MAITTHKVVSKKEHLAKTWHRVEDFSFVSEQRVVPLVGAEFPKACVSFPIAWLIDGSDYRPVGLLGLQESENLHVDAQFRWIGPYIPAFFKIQPFALLSKKNEKLTLGVREDIGLVTDNDSGNPFFNEEGELSDELQPVVDMLRKLEDNRAATAIASRALSEAGLLEPWDTTPVVNGKKKQLGGLYHVSQQALNNVDAETLEHLRNTGALAMAYCQQISQQLIQRLEMLHERRAKAQVKQSMHPADQGGFGLGDDEGISFGGMAGNDDEG